MRYIQLSLVAFVCGASVIISGCSSPASNGSSAVASGAANGAPASPAVKGGAELWASNCNHCHNIRSPSSYSDAQWEVAMMHMRVRANLTAVEHQKILAFLRSAH